MNVERDKYLSREEVSYLARCTASIGCYNCLQKPRSLINGIVYILQLAKSKGLDWRRIYTLVCLANQNSQLPFPDIEKMAKRVNAKGNS